MVRAQVAISINERKIRRRVQHGQCCIVALAEEHQRHPALIVLFLARYTPIIVMHLPIHADNSFVAPAPQWEKSPLIEQLFVLRIYAESKGLLSPNICNI